MLKKIHLETLLVSNTENGEDVIRTESIGGCLIEENGIMLRYAEKQNNGTATLLLTEDLADLKRHGDTEARMTFVSGKLIPCTYKTANGMLDFSLYTHQQSFELDAMGGCFKAKYSMLAAGKQVADNVLTVKWTFD